MVAGGSGPTPVKADDYRLLSCSDSLVQATPAAQPLQPAPGNPVVLIETSMGTITIELFQQQAPASVENFLKYVQEGFYPGTIFHRVVSGYVIQGGGYTEDLNEKAATHPPGTERGAPMA